MAERGRAPIGYLLRERVPFGRFPAKVRLARDDSSQTAFGEGNSRVFAFGEARQTDFCRKKPRQIHFCRNLGSPDGLSQEFRPRDARQTDS